jgi:hypothetical protein
MKIVYLILLFLCTTISLTNIYRVENFLKGYFILSFTTTLTSFIFTDQIFQEKISIFYDSTIVLISILGILIKSNFYSIGIFTSTVLLLFISFTYNININSNYFLYATEVVIFIYLCHKNTQFRKIYNYIFQTTLTLIFLNNYWLKLLYENIKFVKSIKQYETIYYIFGSYLIIYYTFFIYYHVKFRINN